ncbi:MAG: short-chain dehydrogenase [Verrucomicrobiales bacterium]|nr:short-chain dehydrogenase [Verrucomicrobiales bacterium]
MTTAKRVLITGGARGIGAAMAKAFAERGFEPITPSRTELDLAKPGTVSAFIEKNPGLKADVLVNNAGINVLKAIDDIDTATWAEMQQVNLTAPLQLIQAVTPHMKAQGWGRILNISSIFGLVTKEKRAAYSMTKAAINALTRSAAVEFGPHGILVNSLCPGYVDTELTRKNNSPADIEKIIESIPVRRMALAEELARIAVFLCSDENSYISGQAIVADGGFTCK